MKTPKFTDSHRFSAPYRKSEATDITATFRRARAEQKRIQDERVEKVAPLRKAK